MKNKNLKKTSTVKLCLQKAKFHAKYTYLERAEITRDGEKNRTMTDWEVEGGRGMKKFSV